MKYEKQTETDGWSDWIRPTDPMKHKIECCDCSLVHRFQFQTIDGEICYRAGRDNRATGQRRRKRR